MADASPKVQSEPPSSSVLDRKAKVADYFRIFKYARKWDVVMMIVATLARLAVDNPKFSTYRRLTDQQP